MPEKRSPGVRRCLFGKPDRETMQNPFDQSFRQMEDRRQVDMVSKTSKWNFDFEMDRPVNGRFEWEVVSKDEYVPEFYRKGYKTKSRNRTCGVPYSMDFSHLSKATTCTSSIPTLDCHLLTPKRVLPVTTSVSAATTTTNHTECVSDTSVSSSVERLPVHTDIGVTKPSDSSSVRSSIDSNATSITSSSTVPSEVNQMEMVQATITDFMKHMKPRKRKSQTMDLYSSKKSPRI